VHVQPIATHLTLTPQAWLPEEAAGEKNNRGSGLTREVGHATRVRQSELNRAADASPLSLKRKQQGEDKRRDSGPSREVGHKQTDGNMRPSEPTIDAELHVPTADTRAPLHARAWAVKEGTY